MFEEITCKSTSFDRNAETPKPAIRKKCERGRKKTGEDVAIYIRKNVYSFCHQIKIGNTEGCYRYRKCHRHMSHVQKAQRYCR
ncbi:hypothetical protein TNCT_708271 [Trichonephila clavata]|uniref:Uncharacterized protein n=1 Tax=Trichonephila clavata TaxID=2740835 RepID=A0A8X6KN17_TRICU|nr:hypothetical protein TNCT_708271 [Trichonephila clavata]